MRTPDQKRNSLSSLKRICALLVLLFCLFIIEHSPAQDDIVQTIGNYGDITVMEFAGNYDADNPDGSVNALPRQEIAKEFYKTHADKYDFLVIFSNFDFQMPEHEAVAFYLGIKNDVQGIGRETFDHSDLFGSESKLQGTIDMGNIASVVSDPLDPQFTTTMTTLAHELLHRWAAYVRFQEADGGISTELLGKGGFHWSFLLDTEGSVLYGNRWQENGDGTFTSLPGWKYYSPLDLYLMGLYDKSEVPPMLLIDNPDIDPEQLPQEGVTIEGEARTVTIDDIIAVAGERNPSVAESQKTFKTAFILVTRPDTFSGGEITGIRSIMKNWVTWFSGLTDGRAIVQVDADPLEDIPVNPGPIPPPYDPRTAPPEINDAVAWLVEHQETDGSWQDIPHTRERDTAEAVSALSNFSGAGSSVSDGLQWLGGITSGNTDYLARKIEALSLAGGDYSDLITELLARVNQDGGWGSKGHYASNPVDTSFALRALAAADHTGGTITAGAIAYLQAAQHADGGWGCADHGSTIQATANVLAAFNRYRDTYPVTDAIQRGIAWLIGRQNPDGGFGTSPSTIYETAVAALILKQFNVSTDITGEAANYILDLQSEDGSWYTSPYQTALAVSAVWKVTGDPDLSVSTADITITPSSITSLPTEITIEAQVRNLGLTAVPEATVALYDGAVDAAHKIGEQQLAFPGNASVTATFTAIVTDGNAHHYYLVVDPQNQIPESSEANNTALKVLYPETSYDFEILPGNVSVTPSLVDYLQTVTITAQVANRGTTTAYNVPLRYFINIVEGPIHIATHYVDIPAGGSIEHVITWKTSVAGTDLPVTVAVDPFNAIAELSEDNNAASVPLTVNVSTKPNLVISHEDIVLTPSPAQEGGSTHIEAVVKNEGFSTAQTIAVRFSQGLPGKEGTPIGTQTIPSLGPGESTSVALDWSPIEGSGSRIITIEVDPDDQVDEISEEDNTAFTTLEILSLPDLVISTNSITFDPPAPKEGDTVAIQVQVQNAGAQEATNVKVTASEGSTEIASGTIPTIPGNTAEQITFTYETADSSGVREITIVVDPDNTIAELSEDNNTASRTFGVQDADLWLTERYISPNGDEVQDSTQFFFRLEAKQTVRVVLRNEKDEIVRTYAGPQFENTRGDTITWDGLDEKGMVVADGEYQCQVLDENGTIIASLPVVVDNNRSPLVKAIGTPYLLQKNLTCMLPFIHGYNFEWFPDDSDIVFTLHSVSPSSVSDDYPEGLYTMGAYGEDIVRLLDDPDSIYSLSPDGGKIAFLLRTTDQNNQTVSQLWIMDRYGQHRVLLDSADMIAGSITWSPDASYITYSKRSGSSDDYQVWLVKPDGTGKEISEFGYPYWSPDGAKKAYAISYECDDGDDGKCLKIRVIDADGNWADVFETDLGMPIGSGYPTFQWLGNDRLFLYVYHPDYYDQLWLVDASGDDDPIKVAESKCLLKITISPTGKIFAFYNWDNYSLNVCDTSGTCKTLYEKPNVSDITSNIFDLRWSHAGDKLAFVDLFYEKVEDCNYNGYLIVNHIDTGEKRAFKVSTGENPCMLDAPVKYKWHSLQWFADDVFLLVEIMHEGAIAINSTNGDKISLPTGQSGYWNVLNRLSPLGRYLTYYQRIPYDSPCYHPTGKEDLWVMRSLLNLIADLRAIRKDSSVLLKGIAADLNFKEYKLEYADVNTPDQWNPIAPSSEIPVINDALATWIPPYEGTFYVKLTVWDKAGNVAWDRKKVSWGLFSSIANLYKTEEVFSPNGDGVKDTVELHYRALEPVHLEFFIYDEAGTLVRTFNKDHLIPEEDHITWDGKDEGGMTVPDGVYKIQVLDYEFFVHVDNTPPEVYLNLTPIKKKSDSNSKIYVQLLGRAADPNIKQWIVDYGTGENPQEWGEYCSGSNQLQALDDEDNPVPDLIKSFVETEIAFTVGKRFRITAEDFAGNKSTTVSDFLEEAVLFYSWDARWDILFGTIYRLKDGYMIPFSRDEEGQINKEPNVVIPPEYVKPGLHTLWGFETIRLSITDVTVQYREYDPMTNQWHWVDYPKSADSPSDLFSIVWDNSDMDQEQVDAVRLKVIDAEGTVHFSNAVALQPIFAIHVSCKEKYARNSLLESLVLLKFQVKSEKDTRYPEWTDYKVYDVNQGDEIPTDKFELPLPSDLQEGLTYQLRMTGIGESKKAYESNIADYPPKCLELDLEITYASTGSCGSLAPGQAAITASLNDKYTGGVQFKTLNYYIQEDGEFRLLRQFDLTKEGRGGVTVDTTSIPEGSYPVRAVLKYVQDGAPQEVAATGSLIVDRVLPQAKITYPTSSTKVCPGKIEDPEGDWFGIHVEGLATDNHEVGKYEVYYGNGENPDHWNSSMTGIGENREPIEGKGSVQGRIGTWNVTDLMGDIFFLMLKVWDRVDNLSCYITSFLMDTGIYPAISTDKRIFSPNGDGTLDNLHITYSINEYATVDMKVFRDSTLVRTIIAEGGHLPGTETTTWDGRDDSGSVVPDGEYLIVIEATDSCSNTAERGVRIAVDKTPPTTIITYPEPGDPLGIVVEITGTAKDLHFKDYQLTLEEDSTLLGQSTNSRENEIVGQWNTYGLDGSWTLKLTATDTAGNTGETTVTVDLGERRNLIKDLKSEPPLFSPTNDGKLDITEIRYELAEQSDVTLKIFDKDETLKKTHSVASVMPGSYTYTWNGTDTEGEIVPDGPYTVKLSAALISQPEITQAETVTAIVDTTLPTVDIKAPLDGAYLKGTVLIRGTIADTNLRKYTITYAGENGSGVVDEANQNRIDHTFAVLTPGDIAEGVYNLEITATDRGENTTLKNIAFTIDRTPPKVALSAPAAGELFGFEKDKVSIKGTIEEKNLATYVIRYGAGENPDEWTELITGDNIPATDDLFTWNVGPDAGIPDGLYTLSLYAKDKAEWESESKVKIIIDNTLPEVSITAPENGGYVKEAMDIMGTAFDQNLDAYTLEVAEGDCAQAYKWAEIKKGLTAVQDGVLAQWQALPPDGAYCLRITAIDKLGNKAEAKRAVLVDTQPPAPPVLSGEVENKTDARLFWTENTESDLAGYNLYRDETKLNTALITETSYLDQGLTDSLHTYTVKAVDQGGGDSKPSNQVELRIDTTPPQARIRSPQDRVVVSDIVDIKGVAYSADDFKEYRVFIGQGVEPTSWQLIRRSPVTIIYGSLIQWDTLGLGEGQYAVKLEAEDLVGNVATHQITLNIDNAPPAAPVLLTATAMGSDVTLTWQANTEPDLAGYLLYRDDELANASSPVVDELTPYLITGTTYTDIGLPDGTFTYFLVAIDEAGNISDQSNTKQVTIDNHPPQAEIFIPEDGHRFDTTLMIKAQSPDLDIASIQFQYEKTALSTWTDLGAAVTKQPFITYLNPTDLGWSAADYGDYNLRAIATDTGGNTDPSPTTITITYTDVTPPAPPQDLQSLTDGVNVTLNWETNTEPDLAGYNVYWVYSQTSKSKLNTELIEENTYQKQLHTERLYTLEVTAVDINGNESRPSDSVQAVIYAPVITQPQTLTGENPLAIQGSNATPNSTVEVFIDTGAGPQSQGTVDADEEGVFTFDATLELGENKITARATDAQGNRSKFSDEVVVVYNDAPAAPIGLTAAVEDHNVTLTWNPNTESDLAGYNIYRDGERLNNTLSVVTSGTTSASYNSSYASRAFDNDPSTYWSSYYIYGEKTQWWQVDLPASEFINRIEIEWYSSYYSGKDYEVQVWSGYAWITQATVTGEDDKIKTIVLDPSYRTNRIRILFKPVGSSSYRVRVVEVRIWKESLITQPTFTDSNLPDGEYQYHATAVDYYGFESPKSEEALATVGDVIPPDPPENLTATAVGSDIHLSWSANTEPDLAGYHVYKNTDEGWKRINTAVVTGTTYTDAGLMNGTYTYRVTAVDQTDNESDPSNEASAEVSVTLPPKPINVNITVIPEGTSLLICWEYAGGDVVGYNLYRSIEPGGPYERVNTALITDLCFLDTGLINGITYYYMVAAVDAMGNESVYSEQIFAVPSDTAAPQAPVLFYPTTSNNFLVLYTNVTPIAGRAEPGATIDLYQEGAQIGQTTALEEDLTQTFTISGAVYEPSFNPDGTMVAYKAYDYVISAYSIWLYDLTTGNVTKIVSNARLPIWSPDGGRLAYEYYESGRRQIGIYDIDMGITEPLTADTDFVEFNPSWARSTNKLAFISNRSAAYEVWLKDLDTGELTQITNGANPDFMQLSPDGTHTAYRQGQTLSVVDGVSGASTVVDSQLYYTSSGNPFAWSSDGTKLAFISSRNDSPDVYLLDMATQEVEQITATAESELSVCWAPDGWTIGYSISNEVWIVPAAVGEEGRLLYQADGVSLQYLTWSLSGSIAFKAGNKFFVVQPQGSFTFLDMFLEIGLNTFRATATDAAGNTSVPSDAISLIFDAGLFPDLETLEEDIVIYPPAPLEGEQAAISVVIHNKGPEAAENVVANVFILDSTGYLEQVASETFPLIDAFSEEQITVTWDTTGKGGKNMVVVILDPEDRIFEGSEANNLATRDFFVAQHEGVTLTTRTDAEQYGANEDVNITCQLHNSGIEQTGVLEIFIEDTTGVRVSSLGTQSVSLPYNATKQFALVWNTGQTYAGAYRARAVFKEAAEVLADSIAPFSITPSIDITSAVKTDKKSYAPNSDVVLDITVTNNAQNYNIPLLDVAVTITKEGEGEVFSDTLTVNNLLAGASAALKSTWHTGLAAAGDYRAAVEVYHAGEKVSGCVARFTISTSVTLSGTITATPEVVPLGAEVQTTYTVTNTGNGPANGITVRVIVLDPEAQQVMADKETVLSLATGETRSGHFVFSTAGLSLKTYTVLLQGVYGGVTTTLASTSFGVQDRTPPVVQIISPPTGGVMRGPFDLAVKATDNASGVELVEYQVDGGVWRPLPAVDPSTGTYATTWEPVDADEGPHTIQFRAIDRAGNCSQPVPVSITIELKTPCERLTGTLSVDPNPAYHGQETSFAYALVNETDEEIEDLLVRITLLDPDTGEATKTLEKTTTVPAAGTGTGNVTLPTLEVAPQTYFAELQVVCPDVPEPRTLASLDFEVLPSIEVTETIADPINLLVWVNDKCYRRSDDGENHHEAQRDDKQSVETQCGWRTACVRVDLLEAILAEAVDDYLIVYDRRDFEAELRNPYYTDILILGDHHPLTDHGAEELREKVNTGTGILSSLMLMYGSWGRVHPFCYDYDWYDPIFGVRYKGQLPGNAHTITTVPSPITVEDTINAAGQAKRVEASSDTTIAGWIERDKHWKHEQTPHCHPYRYPGIVLNQYGLGKAVYVAFDLGLTLDDENYEQIALLLTNSLTHVHHMPENGAFLPHQLVPIDLQIKDLGEGFAVKVTEHFPSKLMLFDPGTNEWIQESPWERTIQLASDETKVIRYYALMPDAAGTYTIETEVGFTVNTELIPFYASSIELVVERDAETLTDDIIAELNALSVSRKDRAKVQCAIWHLRKVHKEQWWWDTWWHKGGKKEIEKDIDHILKAIECLLHIQSADITAIRLELDNLLRVEEGRYYYFVP